jgi:hypothetical protein
MRNQSALGLIIQYEEQKPPAKQLGRTRHNTDFNTKTTALRGYSKTGYTLILLLADAKMTNTLAR